MPVLMPLCGSCFCDHLVTRRFPGRILIAAPFSLCWTHYRMRCSTPAAQYTFMAHEDRSSIFVRGFLHLVGELVTRPQHHLTAVTPANCTKHPPPPPTTQLSLKSPVCCCAVSQVSSRLITFVLNLLIARLLTPEAYGVRLLCCCRRFPMLWQCT